MSHTPQAIQNLKDNDPSIKTVKRIPVGTIVVYHGRSGSMRQGRTEFPAIVLKQHPDDGSIDLIVWFEAEDQIWEQRVLPWTETNPGHSWSPVETEYEPRTIQQLIQRIVDLDTAMYGDFNPPKKSMIEYLNDFDQRLSKLESKYRSG